MYLTFLGPGVSHFKNEGNPEIGGKALRISLKKKKMIFCGVVLGLQKN